MPGDEYFESDYIEPTLGELGTDASKWAKAFLRTDEHFDIAQDEGTLIAWFANAIEAGRTKGFWAGRNSVTVSEDA